MLSKVPMKPINMEDNDQQYDSSGYGDTNGSYYSGYEYGYGYDYPYGGYDYSEWTTYSYPEDIAAKNINLYLPPLLMLIGSTGNILSAIVLVRLASRTLTTCFYFTLMAIVDTLLLYIRCGNTWIRELAGIDITMRIMSRSHASCQVYSFVSNFVLHLCAWLLVAALIESTIITIRPMKAHKICNLDRAKNVLLIEVLLLVCVNAHFFWTYGLEEEYMVPGLFFCTFSTFGSHYSEYFRNIVWPIMDLLSSSIVPGCIILGSVIYTVRRLYGKGQHGMSILENTYLLNARATHQMVIVAVIVGIASLILTAPETGYNLFEFIIERADLLTKLTTNSINFDAQRRLAQAVCISSRDIFLSCKIFIYCASWESFRKEIAVLFQKMTRVKKIFSPKTVTTRDISVNAEDNVPCISEA